MAYMESLFGHQAEMHGLACLHRERAVTCSSDCTVRFWKFPEESQLVLQGAHKASIDCIDMVNESTFVTGSQEGLLSLWTSSRKKPTALVRDAHSGTWLTSVASMPNSDIIASGGSDGCIKLWSVNLKTKRIDSNPLATLPVPGYINGLAFGASGKVLIAGSGQEHRLGRWDYIKEARNTLHIFRMKENT